MLQATSPLTTESEIVQENPTRELVNWALGIVRRQFAIIALIVVVATSLGAFYAYMAPPTYTAESTIVIDPRRVQLFPKATFSEGQIDSPALESEIELVKSEPVTLSVIKDLGLAKDHEFLGPKNIFGVVLGFASHFFSSSKPTVLSESEATTAALEVLSKNLTVKRVGLSYNLSLQYGAGNPNRAAQIANAIAEAYIAAQLEGKYDSTRRATQWLGGRIGELNQKQALAERAVADFKKQSNIVMADGKVVNEQRLAELNSQLIVAHKQTSEAKARLERIEAVIRDDSFDTKTDPTVTDALNNPVITQLRTKYFEFVNREAMYARKYGANHLAVVNLRDQIRDFRGSILEELKRLREGYLSNYEIAKQEEQELGKRLAEAVSRSQSINQAQVSLRELESSAQTYRTTYDNFRQRYTESLQQQSFPVSDARILTSALPPSSKSSPKPAFLVLPLAAAGGLIFGVAVGVFRELMNGSFCTKAQVESALQTACISVVPIVDDGKRQTLRDAPRAARDQGLGDGSSSRTIVRDQDVIWTALNSPFSRFAEALRSIKLAIDQNSGAASSGRKAVSKEGKPLYGAAEASSVAKREREARAIVGFTSSLPHEGKSTIAASLAVLMAQAGARVILVDCDLRNPSLSRKLAPKAEHGVLDVIAGRVPLEDAVWKEVSTNLTFLPVATKTRIEHSSEILAAAGTKGLFKDLQSKHDYVIVDLSPLMPVVDTRATTRFVDSYVCVIEWEATK